VAPDAATAFLVIAVDPYAVASVLESLGDLLEDYDAVVESVIHPDEFSLTA
jgi:hypothetical protein